VVAAVLIAGSKEAAAHRLGLSRSTNVEQAGSAITGGGIVLLDGKMFGATAPTGNTIRLNRLSGNTPNDIYGDGTGTGNTVSGNTCTKSSLPGAC
jgi:hypothetical protein